MKQSNPKPSNRQSKPEPHIGCAGWSVPASVARVKDTAGKAASHLQTYGSLFNCVEINSSFYRSHNRKTYERWAATVPDDFRFSVKMPQAVTHESRLQRADALVTSFIDEAQGLGPKLGCVLVQLPPSLKFEPARAAHFFAHLRTMYSSMAVVEPRHPSWFSAESETLLRTHRIGRVAADPAPAPGAEASGGHLEAVYVRLHGSPRMYYSAYPAQALAAVAETLRAPAHDRWCIFDNTADGAAFNDAQELQRLLKR